jgi:BMFP domain-containing protein YqiC
MKLINVTQQGNNKLNTVVERLRTQINEGGAAFASPEVTKGLISLEGSGSAVITMVENSARGVFENLKTMVHSIATEAFSGADDISMEEFAVDVNSITDARARKEHIRRINVALESGAYAALAAGAAGDYARKAYTNLQPRNQSSKSHRVSLVEANGMGPHGSMDYRSALHPALESFDERELHNALPYSVAFNVYASRQDDLSETFFPTTVVTPDQAGIDLTVSRLLVFNEVIHSITGKKAEFNKKNIIDAYADYTILGDENTRLIPVLLADASNAAVFAPAAVAASFYLELKGNLVHTAPLLMNQEIDLLGLSNDQYLIGLSVIDNTDSMDARITLDNLYINFGGANSKSVRFPTARFPRSAFVKSVEGNFREMNLQFITNNLVVSKDTVFNDLSAAAFLPAEITSGGYVARLAVTVNGVANVEFGNIRLFPSQVSVDSVQDANGDDVDLTTGAGANIVTALAQASATAYDLHAYRTNLNRRERGLLSDTTYETERYTIPLASPISAPSPIVAARDASDLKSLITICRVRNSNNAVTALLNYADTLRSYVQNAPRNNDSASAIVGIQGMGRYLVKPYYKEINLDLAEATSNIKSYEKAADIAMALVNSVRSLSYDAYQKSYYQPAMDAVTGGSGETPTLVIATDQVLVRHLMVSGDSRTFGTMFDKFLVKSSPDKRLYNTIIGSFIREGVSGPDPLTFGTHAWIPELTSSVTVSRNNATVKEAMVQPRTLHICNLPVMFKINVQNLEQVLGERIAMSMETEAVASFTDGTTDVTGNFITNGVGGAEGGTVPLDATGKSIDVSGA